MSYTTILQATKVVNTGGKALNDKRKSRNSYEEICNSVKKICDEVRRYLFESLIKQGNFFAILYVQTWRVEEFRTLKSNWQFSNVGSIRKYVKTNFSWMWSARVNTSWKKLASEPFCLIEHILTAQSFVASLMFLYVVFLDIRRATDRVSGLCKQRLGRAR